MAKRTPYQKIMRKRAILDRELKELQADCTHPYENVAYTHISDDSNYYSKTEYKTKLECRYCGHVWFVEGSVGMEYGRINARQEATEAVLEYAKTIKW